MQQLEHLRSSLPFFKTRRTENPRGEERVLDPETRLSIEFRHDLEQLLETRGVNIIDSAELIKQLAVPIGLIVSASHGISPVNLVRKRWIKPDDDNGSISIVSYGVNPEKSKWIIMDAHNIEGQYLRLPKHSQGEIRHSQLRSRGIVDLPIRMANISDLLFYKDKASSISQTNRK